MKFVGVHGLDHRTLLVALVAGRFVGAGIVVLVVKKKSCPQHETAVGQDESTKIPLTAKGLSGSHARGEEHCEAFVRSKMKLLSHALAMLLHAAHGAGE